MAYCPVMSGDLDELIVGRYRLAESVGTGGMGAVWRARDETLGRDVAVKEIIFPVSIPEDEQQRACARSLRDSRVAGRLNHPGIITVHDVVEDDGRSWIVMDLFQGDSLADLIEASGPLPPQEVADIGLCVLQALSAAHAAGIVHGDVKPANVLVSDSSVVLTDFGAAAIHNTPTLARSGVFTGTPAYLAPEQARRALDGPESDMWSVGATLYAAVEGRPPYPGDAQAVLSALLTSGPPAARRAGPLAPILDGLMQWEAAQRLTAEQAMGMLEAVADPASAGAPARPLAAGQPARPMPVGEPARLAAGGPPAAGPQGVGRPGGVQGVGRPGGVQGVGRPAEPEDEDGGGARRDDGQPRRMSRRAVVPVLAGVAVLIVALVVAVTLAHHGSGHHNAAGSTSRTSSLPKYSQLSSVPAFNPALHNCGADPHACGYPDATNTGLPKGIKLLSVPSQASHGPGWKYSQGGVNVFGKGAVFAGYSVQGYVNVTGNDAIVEDNAISNSGNDTNGDGINLTGNPSNVTIRNNDISSPHGTSGYMGVYAGIKDLTGESMGTKVLYNNIADASTGVQIYIGLIEGNYIHDVSPASPGSHLNGTTSNGSTVPLTIEHNTVFNPNGQTDAISLFEDFGVEANVLITDNLVAGGGYTIYGGQNAGGKQAYNIKITKNRFSTIYFPQSGYFGYLTAFDPSAPGNVWSGNIWDNTSETVEP
jgi:Protein kinase domain